MGRSPSESAESSISLSGSGSGDFPLAPLSSISASSAVPSLERFEGTLGSTILRLIEGVVGTFRSLTLRSLLLREESVPVVAGDRADGAGMIRTLRSLRDLVEEAVAEPGPGAMGDSMGD